MPWFEIGICRTAHRHASIEVEADTLEEAEASALESAGDLDYGSENDADYEVISGEEMEEEALGIPV